MGIFCVINLSFFFSLFLQGTSWECRSDGLRSAGGATQGGGGVLGWWLVHRAGLQCESRHRCVRTRCLGSSCTAY